MCAVTQELKAQDDRYVKELKRQAEEVELMIERMEEQVESLLRTNREELDHMEVKRRSFKRSHDTRLSSGPALAILVPLERWRIWCLLLKKIRIKIRL